jgi:hypothetical protein
MHAVGGDHRRTRPWWIVAGRRARGGRIRARSDSDRAGTGRRPRSAELFRSRQLRDERAHESLKAISGPRGDIENFLMQHRRVRDT